MIEMAELLVHVKLVVEAKHDAIEYASDASPGDALIG